MFSSPASIRSRRAFTLAELLIVVAILALLAALLFPVLSRAREGGRKSVCQSNLRQIGLGIQQYSRDYDETYLGYQLSYGTADVSWPTLLHPYVKNSPIFACPTASETPTSSPFFPGRSYVGLLPTDGSDSGQGRVNVLSYAMNVIRSNRLNSNQEGWRTPGWGTPANPKHGFISPSGTPLRVAAVPAPSATIFVVDAWTTNVSPVLSNRAQTLRQIKWERGTDYGDLSAPANANTAHTRVASRHLDGFNVLFADGHVQWRTQTKPSEWSVQED